jgi:hypothetical protein
MKAFKGTRAKGAAVIAALVGCAVLLAFAATALGCPEPQGTHWSGFYRGPDVSGRWDTIAKEFQEVEPGDYSFNALGEEEGTWEGLPEMLTSTITGGTLQCGEEWFTQDASGELGGKPVNETVSDKGTYTDTTVDGVWEDSFGETGTYTGEIDPAAGSQGIEPGSTEVIPPYGTVASMFSVAPVTPAELPPGVVAPAGALAFTLDEVPVNGTVDVTLVLPPGSAPTAVYKSALGQFEPYPPDKTKIAGNLVTLELTDNELPWDENSALGVIRDPVIPVEAQAGTAPTIKKLSPKKGTAGTETPVTITGTGFTGATAVRFGSLEATNVKVDSATSITATSPKGDAGEVEVSVATHGGVSAPVAKDHFTFKAAKKEKKR